MLYYTLCICGDLVSRSCRTNNWYIRVYADEKEAHQARRVHQRSDDRPGICCYHCHSPLQQFCPPSMTGMGYAYEHVGELFQLSTWDKDVSGGRRATQRHRPSAADVDPTLLTPD